MARDMTRKFTGWHMTAILCGFFGVVFAVNILMATLAVTTFGGTVVDNSYVASQNYNKWLAEGRKQRAQGWHADVARIAGGHIRVTVAEATALPAEARLAGLAARPVGKEPDRPLRFHRDGKGGFVSAEVLPEGRWLVHLTIEEEDGRSSARFTSELTE